MADSVKVTVSDGWAVYVDGEQHAGGADVAVPTDVADKWQRQGWVARADQQEPPYKRSRTTARK